MYHFYVQGGRGMPVPATITEQNMKYENMTWSYERIAVIV